MGQRNISIALAIFAVLFGFGLRTTGEGPAGFSAAGLFVLMVMFTLLDRRLHRLSHGWRETGHGVLAALGEVINEPEKEVEFSRYKLEGGSVFISVTASYRTRTSRF